MVVVAPASTAATCAPQQLSTVLAVAPASAAATPVPQQQSAVMAVAPASAAAACAPQQQFPVVAATPAAAAATYALQQQSSVAPATSGAEALVAATSTAPHERHTGQQHLLATRKAKAKAAPQPLSAASRFLAAASASLHQPGRRVPASLTGDLCQLTL